MKIKCGRNEFELTTKDVLMFNGACCQLISRKIPSAYYTEYNPIVAKNLFQKLLKEKKIEMFNAKGAVEERNRIEYYRIVVEVG